MHRLALLCTSLVLATTSTSALAQSWSVELLPGGGEGSATGINDLGVIVGALKVGPGYQAVGWPGPAAMPTYFPGVAGATTWSATAINDSGVIAGNGDAWDFPTVWTNGVPTQLPFLPNGDMAQVNDINAAGEIAGWGTGSGATGTYAIRWTPAGPVELPRPSGASTCSGNAINDAGDVVGYCNMSNGSRATLWVGTTPIVLGLLGTATSSNAYDLEDSGLIAGSSTISGKSQATRWADGVPKRLAKLTNNDSSAAYAIGSSGRMVGYTRLKNGTLVATTWLGVNSVTALPVIAGTNHCIANDIDASNEIVGYCYNSAVVPFVWRPVKWVPSP